jgi:putative transposase
VVAARKIRYSLKEKKLMTIRKEILDELLKDVDGSDPHTILGEGGLLKQLTKAVLERALEAELDNHLGYKKHHTTGRGSGNSRNGTSKKTLQAECGAVEINVPRDRNGDFEPVIVRKGQTRLAGLDEKILALYARGMTTRDIQAQLLEMYGVEVSPTLISNVTESVMEEVRQWQNRPLEPLYPIAYFDCLQVKVRDSGRVTNKAVYLALGVDAEGQKELLGIWISAHEGAKFWLGILTELNNRGLKDMLIACVDGLIGLPEAIEAVYPSCLVQLCMVHMVRNSCKYVSWKDRKELCADLRAIYSAATEAEAQLHLELFCERWDEQYPSIGRMWRDNWVRGIPIFRFGEDIRRVIYTTNAIESLNMTIRKVSRNHRIFPTDESVIKMVYLAVQNQMKKWTMPIRNWRPALNRLMMEFEGRMKV